MSLEKKKGPRCLLNCVKHPYIPGRTKMKPQQVNPQLQDIKHIKRLKRRRARRLREIRRQANKTVDTTESPMSIEDDDQAEESDLPKKRKGFAYYPLLTYKRELDKTFYYKYFRPYSHDYRRLRMEEDCQCPHSEPHDTGCEWYDPNIIYIQKPQMTFQPGKKQPSKRSMVSI